MQAISRPAQSAELTLDTFVSRLEDSPIAMNGGRKRALSDTERMLLMQQDELRTLRDSSKAPPRARAPTPTAPELPPAPVSVPEASAAAPSAPGVAIAQGGVLLQSAEKAPVATSAPAEEGAMESIGGVLNMLTVLGAGLLGGLYYQSRRVAEAEGAELRTQVEKKQKVRACGHYACMACMYAGLEGDGAACAAVGGCAWSGSDMCQASELRVGCGGRRRRRTS